MRPKTYFQCYQGKISHLTFQPEHYMNSGLRYTKEIGMPIMEAYMLLNKWNTLDGPHGYSYWLEIQ